MFTSIAAMSYDEHMDSVHVCEYIDNNNNGSWIIDIKHQPLHIVIHTMRTNVCTMSFVFLCVQMFFSVVCVVPFVVMIMFRY